MKKKPEDKKAPGRPLSLTPEIIKEACRLASLGNFHNDIRKRLKISPNTWNSWLDRGRHEIRDFDNGLRSTLSLKAQFVQDLENAEVIVKEQIFTDIINSDDLNLKLKFLNIRYNKQFAKGDPIFDDNGQEVKQTAAELLAEKLAAFIGE